MSRKDQRMSNLTSEEKALLIQVIDKGVKEIHSRIGLEGVTYNGLEDVTEEYGVQRLHQLLESLADKELLIPKEKEPALFCPKCHATQVYSRYTCPRCQSHKARRIELLEHLFCGYTGVKKKFISGLSLKCPICSMDLGPLDEKPPGDGSRKDYKIIGSSFECEECGNKFNRPNVVHVCQKCGAVFDYKMAIYEKLHDYEIPEQIIQTMRPRGEYSVLLIEDDPNDAKIITKYFKKSRKPFKIEHVLKGREGLEKIMHKYFDLILLDYFLPSMNGLKILEEIKKRDIQTPVVMLTGADNRKTAVEAMKLGASDYIVKSLKEYEKLPLKAQEIIRNQARKN